MPVLAICQAIQVVSIHKTSLLYKLQNYIKSFTLWRRTRMIGLDEVEGLLFLEIKGWFKKLAAIFMVMWWKIYCSNHVLNKMEFSFFHRMKDEGVMAVFLKSCSWKPWKWKWFWVFGCFWQRQVSSHASKFGTIWSGILCIFL